MDIIFTTTVLSVAALSAAALTGFLIWAIADNMLRARTPRRDLGVRLASLPMGAMLTRLGGDPQHYLHRAPLVDVRRRLRTCAACTTAEHCERLLENQEPGTAFDFCPNYAALRQAAGEYQQTQTG